MAAIREKRGAHDTADRPEPLLGSPASGRKLNRRRLGAGEKREAHAVSTRQPLKLQTLDQLHDLERQTPGLMKELIRLFVGDAPKQMRLIEAAYGKRDPEGLRQAAHFLRSGALALGLAWLADQAGLLEHMDFHEYGQPASDALVANLRAELHRVLLALLTELKSYH